MREKNIIVLAAGGTGGHLFPAQALAGELRQRGYGIVLMSDTRAERYTQDFPADTIDIIACATPSQRAPLAVAKACLVMARGIYQARKHIKRHKPLAAIGFGGYPSVPPIIAAWSCRVPTAVQEQNAVLGRANKLLARFVDKVALGLATTKGQRPHDVVVGIPVRDAVIEAADVSYDAQALVNESAPFKLLVFGGSQGAHVFSEIVPNALAALPTPVRQRIALTLQCRSEDLDRTRRMLSGLDLKHEVEIAPFFNRMPERIARAHLIISRAGASTVAELGVIGRPAILVPLPNALDHDQRENAAVLAGAGGAWLVEQADLTPKDLAKQLRRLIETPEILVSTAAKAASTADGLAVKKLADMVEELASGRGRARP